MRGKSYILADYFYYEISCLFVFVSSFVFGHLITIYLPILLFINNFFLIQV